MAATRSPAHEVMVPCDCGDIGNCSFELYVADVRIAVNQIDMQQRALQLIADVSSAFATVGGILRKKRR